MRSTQIAFKALLFLAAVLVLLYLGNFVAAAVWSATGNPAPADNRLVNLLLAPVAVVIAWWLLVRRGRGSS